MLTVIIWLNFMCVLKADTGHEEDESSVDRKDDTITDTLAAAVIGVLACFVIIVLILIIRGIYRRRTRTPRREVTQITAVSADINDGKYYGLLILMSNKYL